MALFSFRNNKQPMAGPAGGGFIAAKRPITYGPGIVALVVILGVALALYAVFFSIRVSVESETESLRQETSSLERSRNKQLEADILVFEKRVQALSQLLRSHPYGSEMFGVLEAVTLPTVFYTSFSFSGGVSGAAPGRREPEKGPEFTVELKGEGSSLLEVARQIIAYSQDSRIVRSDVGGFSISPDGSASFNASLGISPAVILRNAKPAAL